MIWSLLRIGLSILKNILIKIEDQKEVIDDTHIVKKYVYILEKVSDKNEAVTDVNEMNVVKCFVVAK